MKTGTRFEITKAIKNVKPGSYIVTDEHTNVIFFVKTKKNGDTYKNAARHGIRKDDGALDAAIESGSIVPERLYTLERHLIDDAWEKKFAFHAKSESDADDKAFGWARYHSFDYSDVRFRLATDDEAAQDWFINNEWVS